MIHYHGTPFSGGIKSQQSLVAKHAMVSYWSKNPIEHVAEITQSFCLDNGAFSAWKANEPYDFNGYAEWASHWVRHPGCDFAVIPDIIDGSEQDNDALLSDFPRNGQWCPVWHLHEGLDRLKELVQEWPRVALGSSGEYADVGDKRWFGRMAQAMDIATDERGVPLSKLHGLRMLDPTIFSHFPFSSADSTNVGRNIGLDSRWNGTYVPESRKVRAAVMMDRIEAHASASSWPRIGDVWEQRNFNLIG